MKAIRSAVVAALSLSALVQWTAAEEIQSTNQSSQAPCPDRLDGFVKGEATAIGIKTCLGTPHHEDHHPDGRFVYLYHLKNGITLTYLFDAGGVLARTTAYKQN